MRVEKREFSHLSCPGQTRKRVDLRVDESWQARVCTRVFLNFLVMVKREQELNKSCSIVPVKSKPHYIIM